MKEFFLTDDNYKIYQPFFKQHTLGFEQEMLFSPVQMRCYHFFMPENYLLKSEFTCIPDGCVDLAFIYDDNDYWVELIGSPTKRKVLQCHPGCHYFGVRFAPGICLNFDRFSLAEITDNEIFFTSADLKIGFFIEKLKELELLREKIELFLRVFAASITSTFVSPAVCNIIYSINKKKGNITISELASDMCYSERQICRLLDASIKLSPKTLCRIVRFQNVIHSIINNPHLDNVQYVNNLSYSDQAHFQREFKEYTGVSPQKFKRTYQNRTALQPMEARQPQ